MRRTVLAPTTVAAASRACHVFLAALLALALTLPAPVAAQEETTAPPANKVQTATEGEGATGKQEQSVRGSGQRAEASSCATAADEVATFTNKDASPLGPFSITGESFDVLYEARTDRESGSFKVTVTEDGETVTETAEITVLPVDDVLAVEDEGPGSFSLDVEDSGGVDFAITVCEADKTGDNGDDAGAANTGGENGGGDTGTADELASLSCDELLVLFRAESGSGQQYEDAAVFADSDVRARVEVCLEEEIIKGTAADEDLPDTGGLSLLALAVLGVVSAAAGLSVIRGDRR